MGAGHTLSSCPHLLRVPTTCFLLFVKEDVDGRNKSGHDE